MPNQSHELRSSHAILAGMRTILVAALLLTCVSLRAVEPVNAPPIYRINAKNGLANLQVTLHRLQRITKTSEYLPSVYRRRDRYEIVLVPHTKPVQNNAKDFERSIDLRVQTLSKIIKEVEAVGELSPQQVDKLNVALTTETEFTRRKTRDFCDPSSVIDSTDDHAVAQAYDTIQQLNAALSPYVSPSRSLFAKVLSNALTDSQLDRVRWEYVSLHIELLKGIKLVNNQPQEAAIRKLVEQSDLSPLHFRRNEVACHRLLLDNERQLAGVFSEKTIATLRALKMFEND